MKKFIFICLSAVTGIVMSVMMYKFSAWTVEIAIDMIEEYGPMMIVLPGSILFGGVCAFFMFLFLDDTFQ